MARFASFARLASRTSFSTIALALLAGAALLAATPSASAQSYPVTVLTDTSFATLEPGGGFGPGVPGDLRYELYAAMAAGGTATITFPASCTVASPCIIVLGAALPPIFEATANTGVTAPANFRLMINGGAPGSVILDGNSRGTNATSGASTTNRVFFVDNVAVTLSNLVIQYATAQGGAGGYGGYNAAGGGGAGFGAGLLVNQAGAVVTVTNTTFNNCAVTGGAGGAINNSSGGASGGGGLAFAGGVSPAGVANGANSGGGGVSGVGGAATAGTGGVGGAGGGQSGGSAAQGSAYAANAPATSTIAGFGGGGGAHSGTGGNSGNGGFGGGGGGSGGTGGTGGFGGGGGGNAGVSAAAVGGVQGGKGDYVYESGGGGGAAGPAIFVVNGTVTISNSNGSGFTATAGQPGSPNIGGTAGTANASPIFNYAGTVNGLGTVGGLPAALSTYGPPTTAVGTTSAAQGVSLVITAAGTTGSTVGTALQVLTQGVTGLDFAYVSGGTCAVNTAYTVGQTCTVQYTLTPQYPGQRLGAVNLTNSSGAVLATAYISGTGTGPLATLSPGLISTVAGNGMQCVTPTASPACGDGTAATAATLNYTLGVVVDGAGNLYIADYYDQRIRKVTAATGLISTVAGNGTGTYVASQDMGTTAATATSLNDPFGVALDGAGNLYIADYYNQRIRKVTAATGFISTVAGNGTQCATPTASPACGDGGAATAASLTFPIGVSVDGAGNLYIADYSDHRIRKVTAATGSISTVAGNGNHGYTASQDTGTTAATAASLNYPFGVALDGTGNLYIADDSNNRIRKVTAATGFISTVAGNGTNGYTASQDTGTTAATAASLNSPTSVAVDGAGNLYIADELNRRIRKVTAATGFISTVAGNGTNGYTASQDTGTTAATAAPLANPTGVAVDGAGNLYIADEINYRVRKVSVTGDIVFPTATAAGTSDATDGTQTVTVNNIGNLPLVFTSQVETGSSFVLGNPMTGGCVSNGTVAAGASCLIGATFAPVAGSYGNLAGYVTLTDNSLNVSGTTQTVLLEGTTTAGVVTVGVANVTAATGATTATLQFVIGYSGTAGDVGAVTVSVNGATVAGTPACKTKAGHSNCTLAYNPSALALGNYPISVTIAADAADGYLAGSGSGTLSITTTGMAGLNPGFSAAQPLSVTAPVSVVEPAHAPAALYGGALLTEPAASSAYAGDSTDSTSAGTPPAACTDEAKAAAVKRGNATADCPR